MKLKQTVGLAFLVILAVLLAACGAPADSSYEQTSAPESGNRPEGGEGAQGGPSGFGGAGLMQIISDATGLDVDSIRQQTADGATLAEIITANGGNVEEVKARLTESMSQMPNADEADIEQRVSDLLNNPVPQPGPGGGPGGPGGFGDAELMQIISDATGLDIDSVRQQTADGATLAEIITANGGNVEEVKARLIESMSQMPNADETDIEQRVSDLLNNPVPQPGPGDGSGGAPGTQSQ